MVMISDAARDRTIKVTWGLESAAWDPICGRNAEKVKYKTSSLYTFGIKKKAPKNSL